MSENIKTITIYNSENKIVEERNIGVDAERVDCGESTLDTKLQNIDNNIETINTNIKNLSNKEIKVADITDLICTKTNFTVGASDETLSVPEDPENTEISTTSSIQEAFYKTIGKTNVWLNSSFPSGGAAPINQYTVPSMNFMTNNFSYMGYEPNDRYNISVAIYDTGVIPEPDEPFDITIVSNKNYLIVSNDKINTLADNEITLAEALAYSSDAEIDKTINIKIYHNTKTSVGGSKSTKSIDKDHLINYDITTCPSNRLSVYSARDLWYENQFLRNCIKDLYIQINELKTAE